MDVEGLSEQLLAAVDNAEASPAIESAKRSVRHSVNAFLAASRGEELVVDVKKPTFQSATADQVAHILVPLDGRHPTDWTLEELAQVIQMVRTSAFIYVGTTENKRALQHFSDVWAPFAYSRPDIMKQIDPEIVVFQTAWIPPAAPAGGGYNMAAAVGQVNGTLTNPSLPLPAGPAVGGVIPNSNTVFMTAGNAADARHFAAFVAGAVQPPAITGFYHFTGQAGPPIFYPA